MRSNLPAIQKDSQIQRTFFINSSHPPCILWAFKKKKGIEKMNRNKKYIKVLLILSLVAAMMLVACAPENNEHLSAPNVHSERNEKGGGYGNGDGNAGGNGQGERMAENANDHSSDHTVTADGELNASEIEGLHFMREEEKLAGDVYRFFYERWGTVVFGNIASSEDEHTQSIRELLDAYSIADPASTQLGIFQNKELQSLYGQLTTQGSQSERDALLVGAAIEEIDILDLDGYIAETSNSSIIEVYENLRSGSENHLRAFTKVLENQYGETYSPVYLTAEQYAAILDGSQGMSSYRGGNQSQGNGRKGNS